MAPAGSMRAEVRFRPVLTLILGLILILGLCPGLAQAHDVWIEPSSFAPQPGQAVGLRLKVGQDLEGEPLQLLPGLVKQFVVQDSAGRKPVAARLGDDTAGWLRIAAPGMHIVGYYSHPSFIELPAEKFNAYLAEEGLDGVIAQRAQRHQSDAIARELYARCAKSLVLSGPPVEGQGDRRLGFPLELVAERNPYALAAGQDLPVRLTYLGRPLAGALVVAVNSLNPTQKQARRSDSEGRVNLQIQSGGMWLVKAVHMVAAPPGWNAEWSSLWASLTFELAPR